VVVHIEKWGQDPISKESLQSKSAVKNLSESDKEAYYAGIIDGEGYISYETTRRKKNVKYQIPSISVEMSDLDVVQNIHTFFKCGSVVTIRPRQNHHKFTYRWRARGKAAVNIFFKIYSFLSLRRKNKIDMVLKMYIDNQNHNEKYNKLNKVLEEKCG
jgi:hypothetical protein